MIRALSLSLPGYPCPEGNGDAGAKPLYGWRPGAPVVLEETTPRRTAAEILGIYHLYHAQLGPFPQEVFDFGVTTSKPHCTNLTFSRPAAGPREAADAAGLRADQLTGRLRVVRVDAGPRQEISLAQITRAGVAVEAGDIVFFHTGWSAAARAPLPTARYCHDSPGLSYDAAEWLVRQRVKAVGVDARTVEPIDQRDRSVKDILNAAGIVVVEDLANLDKVTDAITFVLIGTPLNIHHSPGGPARVVGVNLEAPEQYVDLSSRLTTYPIPEPTIPVPYLGPYPERVEPREYQAEIMRWTRLTPFLIRGEDVRGPNHTALEYYVHFSHATTSHIEGAYSDPMHKHHTPDEVFRRYVTMPLDRCIGPASLLNLTDLIGPRQPIEVKQLKQAARNADIRPGDMLFVRTDMNDWYTYGAPIDITPGFTLSAAEWLVEQGIRCLVIDFPAVERSNPGSSLSSVRYTSNDVHYLLHNNDIPIVEKPARFSLIQQPRFVGAVLPLQTARLGGFPCHVMALEQWNV